MRTVGLFSKLSLRNRAADDGDIQPSDWRSLAIQATDTMELFVLRPQSEIGKKFIKSIERVMERLNKETAGLSEFEAETAVLESEASSFAIAQREEIEGLITDLSGAVAETLERLSSSIDVAGEPIASMDEVRKGLVEAQKAESLEETRRLLTRGVDGLKKLVQEQTLRERTLRAEYQSHVKRLSTKLQQASDEGRRDSLTELSNRRGFEEFSRELEEKAKRDHVVRSVAMLDMDGFKALNDNFGHAAGDAALITFAKRLKSAIGDKAFIARLGGDEFVVVAESTRTVLDGLLGKLLVSCYANACFHGDRRMTIRFSYGIAEFDGTKPLQETTELADKALYDFKTAQRAKKTA